MIDQGITAAVDSGHDWQGKEAELRLSTTLSQIQVDTWR